MTFNYSEEIILENASVRLSPLEMRHADLLSGVAFGDVDLLQFSFNHVYSPELMESAIRKFVEDREKHQRYPFVIFDKKSDQYAGVTTFMNISSEHGRLESGSTWIGRKFHKTGLNRNCKFLLLQYCFETLKTDRVEFKTDARNEQSKTAIQKIGGKFEGEMRSHSVMPDGFRRNTVMYSILRDEWPELKETIFKGYF